MSDLPARVRSYALKHNLFHAGKVIVAVSGGVDSISLLHILHTLRSDLLIDLHVATFDHGLRGLESAADAEFVRKLAESWGLPVTLGRANPADYQAEHGIEATARRIRYDFLLRAAAAEGAITLATGHNRDDQAETVLMHLLRGSGLSGLRGMLHRTPLGSVDLVRPLLDVPRQAIEEYAVKHGLSARSDTTNAEPIYLRNRIRLEALPYLKSFNPALRETLAHTAETLRADEEALREAWRMAWGGESLTDFERAAFLALPLSFQRLTLREAIRVRLSGDLEATFDQIEALRAVIERNDSVRTDLVKGLTIRVVFGRVRIDPADSALSLRVPSLDTDESRPVSLPGIAYLSDGWTLTARRLEMGEAIDLSNDTLSTALTLPDSAQVYLRRPRAGDRIQLAGLNGHSQKLSDLFINLKVPREWRPRVPLLVINEQVGWVIVPTDKGPRSRIAEPFSRRLGANWVFSYQTEKA